MNHEWTTRLYFPLLSDCTFDFLKGLVRSLTSAGLEFSPPQTEIVEWFSPRGGPTKRVPTIDAAVELTRLENGGSFSIFSHETGARGAVGVYPCGMQVPSDKYAESFYGIVSLYFHSHDLTEDGETLSKRRMLVVFRASQILARAVGATYGVGDMLNRRLDGLFVRAADLRNWNLPRLGWWNFFNRQYVNRLGEESLVNTGAWAVYMDLLGLTIILRPPEGQLQASNEDYYQMGLEQIGE